MSNYLLINVDEGGDDIVSAFLKANQNFSLLNVNLAPSVDTVSALPPGDALWTVRFVRAVKMFYVKTNTGWVSISADVSSEVTEARGSMTTLNARLLVSLSPNGSLQQNIVDTLNIKDNAVVEAKIADNAITTIKVNNNAVTEVKIASNAITEAKIANNAVTEAKIANNAVTEAKIANNAVTEAKIASDAVTEAKIANNAVTEAKIANGSIVASKLNDNVAGEGIVRNSNGSLSPSGLYIFASGKYQIDWNAPDISIQNIPIAGILATDIVMLSYHSQITSSLWNRVSVSNFRIMPSQNIVRVFFTDGNMYDTDEIHYIVYRQTPS